MAYEALKDIVGRDGWTSDTARLEPHLHEWRDTWHGQTPLMLMPATTGEVAAIMSVCAARKFPVVPQGGNSSLCGGAIPDASGKQILLSMSRMNRIRSISAANHSMVVEAGCVLANVQQAAADAGRLFPLSLAAEGSCQIGGNLSTNAGGTNVLRYGTARDQVLGLEVVLANGAVLDGLRGLRKDTAGYDLKHLFIGAEGTLGIITAASLKLYPRVNHLETALVAVRTPHAATQLLGELRGRLADQLQAFELMSDFALSLVQKHINDARNPLAAAAPWLVLIEAAAPPGHARLDEVLLGLPDDDLIDDAIVAKNATEAAALWRLRHSISAAQKREGASLKHDISVPVSAVGDFIEAAETAVLRVIPGARVVAFGHVGDGNVHFNISQPADWSRELFLQYRGPIADLVYDVVAEFDGSISAEHGIGVLKRDALLRYRSAVEIDLMRAIKKTLDPANLLNPGKVL